MLKSLGILLLSLVYSCGAWSSAVYPEVATVQWIDQEQNETVIELPEGQLFAVEGCDDFMVGDLVSVWLDSMGTDSVLDDEIVYIGPYRGEID